MSPSLTFFALLAAWCAGGPADTGTTWYVDVAGSPPGDGTPGSPYTSLQDAIARRSTQDGDTLLVLPGTYFENVDFLGKAIAVVGTAGASSTILDGRDDGSVVTFASGEGPASLLDGFTIQNGSGTGCCPLVRGGGIYCVGASPTLVHLVIAENRALFGGGVYLESSSATLSSCTIRANLHHNYMDAGLARGIGVHADCGSSPLLTDCEITLNLFGNHGGGIYGAGTYVRCTITENLATRGAGAFADGCDLELVDCTLSRNVARSVDGDIGIGGGSFGGRLVGCTITDNLGGFQGGGAIEATLVGCTVSGNSVDGDPFAAPFPVLGGGTADCDLLDCDVFDNRAGRLWYPIPVYGNGGGIAGGTATDSRIHHNRAFVGGACPGCPWMVGYGGGGAFDAVLVGCDVHENAVDAEVTCCTFPAGGGLFGGSATHCTIWQNLAPYGAGAADAVLDRCTLHGNVSSRGGSGLAAIVDFGGRPPSARDTILWDFGAAETAEPYRGSLSISYSVVRGGASGVGNVDAAPELWGPWSGDFHLKSGSPCIDAGDPASAPDPDQTRADVGAVPYVEGYCGMPGRFCVAKTNSRGCDPSIGYEGKARASGPDNFHVTASGILNRTFGFLTWGRAAAQPPFAGGESCVRGRTFRTTLQFSGGSPPPTRDCSGRLDFHFSREYMAAHGVGIGSTVYAQWHSRDPGHPDGTNRSDSDAIEFTVCP